MIPERERERERERHTHTHTHTLLLHVLNIIQCVCVLDEYEKQIFSDISHTSWKEGDITIDIAMK